MARIARITLNTAVNIADGVARTANGELFSGSVSQHLPVGAMKEMRFKNGLMVEVERYSKGHYVSRKINRINRNVVVNTERDGKKSTLSVYKPQSSSAPLLCTLQTEDKFISTKRLPLSDGSVRYERYSSRADGVNSEHVQLVNPNGSVSLNTSKLTKNNVLLFFKDPLGCITGSAESSPALAGCARLDAIS